MTAFAAPDEKDSRRITAFFVPGANDHDTSGRSSLARVIVTVRVTPPGLFSSRVTSLPSGPRTRSTTSSTVRPATPTPSTVRISSPAFTPAASAGLSGRTRTIISELPCWSSTAPIPTNVPERESSRAFTSSGVRYPVWPRSSRMPVIPSIAPRSRTRGSSASGST